MKRLTPNQTKTELDKMTMIDIEHALPYMVDWEKTIAQDILDKRNKDIAKRFSLIISKARKKKEKRQ